MSSSGVPLSIAFRNSMKRGYTRSIFRNDLTAALIVSLVAMPLAMALSIAVGLPPQHGLYTAIVAGLVVPLLGGSGMQVSGPTAAFVVIVAPIVSEHGLRGLIIATILAGLIMMAMGLAKFGRYINYVPYPVTTGFTSGIAVVIGTLALNDFLGLHAGMLQGSYLDKLQVLLAHLPTFYWPEALVGGVTLAVIFGAPRLSARIPSPVLGIAIGTALAYYLQQHYGITIDTIGGRFTYALPDGTLAHGIPPYPPVFHLPGLDGSALFALPSMAEIHAMLVPALVIATLGALESLLSATVADGIAGTKHHPNAELVGIGIGNILSGLVAGVPATGAIARTAANIHSGAKTPLAASMHALFIMAYVLLLAPYLSYIPMAALAALLLHVAYRMSHWRQFLRTMQIAPRADIIVLVACFGFTVFIDMVAGVTVGVVLACFLLVQRVAVLTHADISHGPNQRHHKIKALDLPDDTLVYHINGALFFATVEKALDRAMFIQGHINTLVLDMEAVPLIDMSGLVAMKTLILDMHRKGMRVIMCGPSSVLYKILQKLPAEIAGIVTAVESLDQAATLAREAHAAKSASARDV
ncbi:MAG: SulP family inorganic anion transporter [Alphaproteobacteria bacterium]|nr:SulP family inorganic anion transporter [Alphaproteobacteria bacterium]